MSLDAKQSVSGYLVSARPLLIVRCMEGVLEAFIDLGMSPDPELGLYNGATVRLRFDESAAFTTTTSLSTDRKAIFFNGVSLIRQMMDADQMLFGFTPYNSSPAETTFDTHGLDVAIQPLGDGCTLP